MQRKSYSKIKEQVDAGLLCSVTGCNEGLSLKTGAGQHKLCKNHQLQLRENGGTARIDRLYTFDKVYMCSCCDYDPVVNNEFVKQMIKDGRSDADIQRAISACIHVDHIDGDHDNNDPSNLQYLCANCHAGKTIANNDHLS